MSCASGNTNKTSEAITGGQDSCRTLIIQIGQVTSLDIRDISVKRVDLENVRATSIYIDADTVIIHPEANINFLEWQK